MSKTWMSKTGFDNILVDDSMVVVHAALGWSPLSGAVEVEGGADISNVGNPAVSAGTLESLMPRHYQITPAAVSAVGIHAAVNLGAAAQDVTSAISNPDFPRTLTIKGNVSGITGNVVLSGTNVLGEAISDTVALNGASEVEGVKAFKTVTKIHLPAQTHTPTKQVETATVAAAGTKQVETATVVGTITPTTGGGDASVIVTAAGMTGSPKTIAVAVLESDDASAVADKIRTALGLDAAVTALFAVSGATDKVILTSKTYAADDGTLNISIDNGTCTGLTPAPTSANTTAGVAVNTIGGSGNATVIVTAAGMTGTPKTISVAVLAGDTVNAIAAKIIAALTADADVSAKFTVGGTGATVTLTSKTYIADDATLNISIANGTCAGLTTAGTSANTTAGVGYDTVSVGFAKKFGLPHIVYHAARVLAQLFNGSTDGGALAVDADEIEKNLYALDGTPDSEDVLDLDYLA